VWSAIGSGRSPALVESIDFLGNIAESRLGLLSKDVFLHGLGLVTSEVDLVLLVFGLHGMALSASEEVTVLLLWEVNIVVSVCVRELSWQIAVILVQGIGSQLVSSTVFPSLELEVRHRAASVVIADLHGAAVGLVVDDFSAEKPLLLLTETLENMVWANLHDAELLW